MKQGRAFAWQEAIIALATIFQRFEFRMGEPSYTLELKQSLTIKPDGFYFYATPRPCAPAPAPALVVGTKTTAPTSDNKSDTHVSAGDTGKGKDGETMPLHVLYGSNTGSSEAFAQRIASAASGKGESKTTKASAICVT
jgi:cytochrome P450/NADPH-cytochrome P450 reductase